LDEAFLSRFQSSFEKNHWSDNNALWKDNVVHEPRVPTPADNEVRWDVKNYVPNVESFLGRPNSDAKRSLQTLIAGGQMRNVLFHGAAGSGKTGLMTAFVKEFYVETVEDGRLTMKDCVYSTTGEEVAAHVKKFQKAVESWKKKLDHKVKKTGVVPALKWCAARPHPKCVCPEGASLSYPSPSPPRAAS
jgi:hypothetical protein